MSSELQLIALYTPIVLLWIGAFYWSHRTPCRLKKCGLNIVWFLAVAIVTYITSQYFTHAQRTIANVVLYLIMLVWSSWVGGSAYARWRRFQQQ